MNRRRRHHDQAALESAVTDQPPSLAETEELVADRAAAIARAEQAEQKLRESDREWVSAMLGVRAALGCERGDNVVAVANRVVARAEQAEADAAAMRDVTEDLVSAMTVRLRAIAADRDAQLGRLAIVEDVEREVQRLRAVLVEYRRNYPCPRGCGTIATCVSGPCSVCGGVTPEGVRAHCMTRTAFDRLIDENVAWLVASTADTLERRHIVAILRHAPDAEYGPRTRSEDDTRVQERLAEREGPIVGRPITKRSEDDDATLIAVRDSMDGRAGAESGRNYADGRAVLQTVIHGTTAGREELTAGLEKLRAALIALCEAAPAPDVPFGPTTPLHRAQRLAGRHVAATNALVQPRPGDGG